MTQIIWHNGNWKDTSTAVLTAHDRLRLGEGVFNTILCIDGKLQHAEAHFEKLLRGCTLFWPSWTPPSAQSLITIAHELLQKNNAIQGHHSLNCTISGGDVYNAGIATADHPTPTITIRATSVKSTPKAEIHAIIAQSTRRNEHSPTAAIKGSFYADHILALQEAQHHGANEAILLNTAGNICCSTVATLVMVSGNTLITPPIKDGVQDGVTRRILLQKHNTIERSITQDELLTSDGIYLLNSVRGALCVTTLNGNAIPQSNLLKKDFHLR